MYHLIVTHSILRYVLLLLLIITLYLAWEGRFFKKNYSRTLRILSGATSGMSHVQLLLGFVLYMRSPVVQSYWADKTLRWSESFYFALVHLTLMSTAVVLLTIGASLAKREPDEQKQFRILFKYFAIALLIILIAIPWPFSPLAQRPMLRTF